MPHVEALPDSWHGAKVPDWDGSTAGVDHGNLRGARASRGILRRSGRSAAGCSGVDRRFGPLLVLQ